MKARLLVLAPALALALAGCGRSMNPQMKSAVDETLAAYQSSSRELAAPSSFEPSPWAPGQWALYRMTDKDGQPSLVRMSVLEGPDGGFWIETDTQDYYQRSVTKVLYSRFPRSAEEAIDAMQKVVTRVDDKKPEEMDFRSTVDNPFASMMKGMAKQYVQGVAAPAVTESSSREDVVVRAGAFRGCARITSSFSVLGRVVESVAWYHPGVPIGGTVKSVSSDGELTMELLDFGFTGAKSAL